MKPESWKDCPVDILENFLHGCDLDYDHYDSSMAEVVHNILNGYIWDDNEKIVEEAWGRLSEDDFKQRCKDMIRSLECQIGELKKFV